MAGAARQLGAYVSAGATTVLRACLILTVLVFAIYAVLSLVHPYPIDYGEAPIVDQAMRLARLSSIYRRDLSQPPYTVSNYPPVFPLVLAPLVAVFGPTFAPARLLSVLGAVATAVMLARIVALETRSGVAAWTVVGTFLASPYVVRWSPLARVDMLALALSVGALLTIVADPAGQRSLAICAGLLVASVFTRQSYGLAAPLTAFVWTWTRSGRARGLRLAAYVGAGGLVLFALLTLVTRGGFYRHTILANANTFELETLRRYAVEFVETAPVLVGAALVFLVLGVPRAPLSVLLLPYVIGAAAAAATIGKIGSNVNYLLELTSALSLAGGVLLGWLLRPLAAAPAQSDGEHAHASPWRVWVGAAVMLALAVQALLLVRASLIGPVNDLKWRTKARPAIDRLALAVRATPAQSEILADEYMGLLTLQRRALYLQPFERTQLARDGNWDPAPLEAQIREQIFPLIMIHTFPNWPVYRSRWTQGWLDATMARYIATDYAADTVVFQPRHASMVYPSPDVGCSDAPWRLPSRADFGAWWYSREIWPMGEGVEGTVPVFAVADGELLRRPQWHDAVAIRHQDPEDSAEHVWTFYGDMASGWTGASYVDARFSPDAANPRVRGVPVRAGDLLGYQGQASQSGRVWSHVRFAVLPALPDGGFPAGLVGYAGPDDPPLPFELAEAGLMDPSRYLGTVRSQVAGEFDWLPPRCEQP